MKSYFILLNLYAFTTFAIECPNIEGDYFCTGLKDPFPRHSFRINIKLDNENLWLDLLDEHHDPILLNIGSTVKTTSSIFNHKTGIKTIGSGYCQENEITSNTETRTYRKKFNHWFQTTMSARTRVFKVVGEGLIHYHDQQIAHSGHLPTYSVVHKCILR